MSQPNSPCEPNDSKDDSPPWLVFHNSKLYQPADEEFLFMHKQFESLQVEDGKAMGKLKAASTIKHWLSAGLEKKHAVILRSVTNDVLRTGMYVSTCVAGEDTNDWHTLRNVSGKIATLLVEHWNEEVNKLPEKAKAEAKEEYEQLLTYVKPAEAPEPKNSKNWKEHPDYTMKNWVTSLVQYKPEERGSKDAKKAEKKKEEPELTGVARWVQGSTPKMTGGEAQNGTQSKPKEPPRGAANGTKKHSASSDEDEEVDVHYIAKQVRKRRRGNVDDYTGKLVTVPAWLFDEAMATWIKLKLPTA